MEDPPPSNETVVSLGTSVAANPYEKERQEAASVADLERAVLDIRKEVEQDRETQWNLTIKEQGEVDASRIADVAEETFVLIEAAMHADVESNLRGTPEALASASEARGRAMEKLQELRRVVEAAQSRGQQSLQTIVTITAEVPPTNLASKILKALGDVRAQAVLFERAIARESVANRLERLGAQRRLAEVARDSGKLLKDQEDQDQSDLMKRLDERFKRQMEGLRGDSVVVAEYWSKIADALAPILVEAGGRNEATAVREANQTLKSRMDGSVEEILRAAEAAVKAGALPWRRCARGGVQGAVGEEGQGSKVTEMQEEMRGLEEALHQIQLKNAADTRAMTAEIQNSDPTKVGDLLRARDEAAAKSQRSITALQARISNLKAQILTAQAQQEREVAGKMLEARQALVNPEWQQKVDETLQRVNEIRADARKHRDVLSRARLEIRSDNKEHFVDAREREFTGYRHGCEASRTRSPV